MRNHICLYFRVYARVSVCVRVYVLVGVSVCAASRAGIREGPHAIADTIHHGRTKKRRKRGGGGSSRGRGRRGTRARKRKCEQHKRLRMWNDEVGAAQRTRHKSVLPSAKQGTKYSTRGKMGPTAPLPLASLLMFSRLPGLLLGKAGSHTLCIRKGSVKRSTHWGSYTATLHRARITHSTTVTAHSRCHRVRACGLA